MPLAEDDKRWLTGQLGNVERNFASSLERPAASPSIGRIVHFRLDHTEAEVVPAIITAVESESAVTLVLVSDVAGINGSACRHVERGDNVGQWNWPPRV